MAARYVAQIIIQGTTVLARAFFTAYQQALQNARAGGAAGPAATILRKGMHHTEAAKVLNIDQAVITRALLEENYKRHYDNNDPGKGGSFYLQSKIFRAHETLDRRLKRQEAGLKMDEEEEEADKDKKKSETKAE